MPFAQKVAKRQAKQKKRRTCAVSHPHRNDDDCRAESYLLHATAGQQLLHFEANEKQFWCSNYVCQTRAFVLQQQLLTSLLPQSFVLHMTKMLAASVKDCTEHESSRVQVWQALHTIELPTRPICKWEVQSAVIIGIPHSIPPIWLYLLNNYQFIYSHIVCLI